MAKALVWLGLVPGFALIETRGRRTGRRRVTVVGVHLEGSTGWVVAEHGRHAGYVNNIRSHPDVRLRIARRWRPARAAVLAEDDAEARLERFERPLHAAAVRRFGTDPTTVRLDFAPGDDGGR